MNEKILVVVAHPDDEILGIGGTLIKQAKQGDEIFCLILGEGAMARTGISKTAVKKLRQEAIKAGRTIGFKKTYFSDFPDNSFDKVALLKIIKTIERFLEIIKPDIIYTHHDYDLNIDHCLTFQAVWTACRPCNKNCPKEIYTFETLSCSEWQTTDKKFKPNVYVDISNVIDKKIEALKKYSSEIRKYPHPRSPEGVKILAQYRGLECGLKFAEAFCLVRKLGKLIREQLNA
jgi:LmbE family N-acetylglucosaminyl deacetylase